ncbi:MAG: hypothetical protein ACREI3_07935 [Nitrospirales bacterium]
MPVNMDPKKRLRKSDALEPTPPEQSAAGDSPQEGQPQPEVPAPAKAKKIDEPTEADLAEKELKHLWDATEVIDMDTW